MFSVIAQSQAIFTRNNLSRKFLKARDAVVKNKHASALDDLKQRARDAQNLVGYVMQATKCDINAAEVAAEFCGYGREWKANAKLVEQTAAEHGIDCDQARDMLEATMTQAQYNAQINRGKLASIFEGWLADIDPEACTSTDEGEKILAEIIIKAYATAGQWLRRDEGILIEGDAEDLGVLLPQWKDVLPKKSEATQQLKDRIRANNNAREEQAQKQYVEAMREIEF